MRKRVGVYGASGYGREVMPLVRMQFPTYNWVFIDDSMAPGEVNGCYIVHWRDFLSGDYDVHGVVIAIASSIVRKQLAQKCDLAEVKLIEARAASVLQMDEVVIGEGACLSPFVTLTSNIRIGRCFHANLYSYVAHDCIIGDFVTLAPSAKLNGNVRIGDGAYIGTGAVIRQGISIGEGATIGMGAVVTRDVAAGVTVVGNPARPLVKE